MVHLSKGIGLFRNEGGWRKHDDNRLYNVKIFNIRVVIEDIDNKKY